jgi:hypothetical protein
MLEWYMFKKINILLFCVVFVLSAEEPLLVFYENGISNGVQVYSIDGYNLNCSSYGIVTLEMLYKRATDGSVCKKEIVDFYDKNPKSKFYTKSLLKYKQLYHIEIKGMECLVYLSNQQSISETLLSKGLAILKPLFDDEEFKDTFVSAQKRAKLEKRGLWSENIFKNCIKELSQ